MPTTCPVCMAANPEGARFCNSCGSRLPDRAALAEERKVITALFCDLVGFTASSESADPEDVDRMLTRYFATARRQIEAHGGVVEKFIGDAVVGVFGVPLAHEDDPERAVRAALRICQDTANLPALRNAPLPLRIGINTGEALVRLAVTPGAGERFLAGDAINTASRIQSVAPEMGVAVGEATYEATKRSFEYEELPAAVLKGKASPVRIFHAVTPRSRLGIDLSRGAATPLVGRSHELRALTELFDATIAEPSLRFATVVGEPGLGKSRIVAELLAYADAQPVLVTWRHGRCLPYGTGISFWALGEIVKAHAGILESDGTETAVEKLEHVLPETNDRAWLRDRLLPLLGIESGPAAGREEQFAAWRRFLELMAAKRPVVLVFEDLHWADESMLSFLDDLVARPQAISLLAIGTTRPDLFDRRPDFPRAAKGTRIDLRPLSPDAAAELATALLEGVEMSADVRDPLLERAGGNPLFVEEFVRLLRDRNLLDSSDDQVRLREGAELPVPDSIHAIVAARLDALPPESKTVLADAAVVGKVFWTGAILAMADRDPGAVRHHLELLAAREFIRIAPSSSMADEPEYAFWHALVRDVAYGALPRAARASRHVAVAGWIEDRAGDRVEDVADVLSHHYATALDLARAMGDEAQEAALRGPALRFELLAGERALELDVSAAAELLARALELAGQGHPERPAVLRRYGRAMQFSGRTKDAIDAFEEALVLFRAAGDISATADVLSMLASILRDVGDARGWTYPGEAADLLEQLGPSWQLADALVLVGFILAGTDQLEESSAALNRADAVAAEIPDPRARDALPFQANLLGTRGMTRLLLGDEAGLDEIREGLRLAIETGASNRAGHTSSNLAQYEALWVGPATAMRTISAGVSFAMSRGLDSHVAYHHVCELVFRFEIGDHDRMIADSPALDARLESFGLVVAQIDVRSHLLRIEALRGEHSDASALSWIEDTVRASIEPDALMGLAASVPVHILRGDPTKARQLLVELRPTMGARSGWNWQPRNLAALVRAALELADADLAESLQENFHVINRYGEHAAAAARGAILEARGELPAAIAAYQDAARRWSEFGVPAEEAFALLGWGRSLIASDHVLEANGPLAAARDLFTRLKAAPALTEIDELLGHVGASP